MFAGGSTPATWDGISYALPIVVAALAAPANDDSLLIIIENPGSHLTPPAQSAMGAFLAHCRVQTGGPRTATTTTSSAACAARWHSATPWRPGRGDPSSSVATPPLSAGVTELSRVSHWPAGFFDQADDDLHQLARLDVVGDARFIVDETSGHGARSQRDDMMDPALADLVEEMELVRGHAEEIAIISGYGDAWDRPDTSALGDRVGDAATARPGAASPRQVRPPR